MALRADEGRDKLRKAAGRSKYPLIRRYPNGETHLDKLQVSIRQSITYGREEPKPACVHAGVMDCISYRKG